MLLLRLLHVRLAPSMIAHEIRPGVKHAAAPGNPS